MKEIGREDWVGAKEGLKREGEGRSKERAKEGRKATYLEFLLLRFIS